ncbi:MAG: phosphate ABC transporter substrate-binding/OmpA family protein [Pseudomonadota bacterium]
MSKFANSVAAAALFAATPFALLAADDVVLKSRATGFTLVGELLEFDGTTYVIQSNIGKLNVLAGDVDCTGEGCPDLAALTSPAPTPPTTATATAPATTAPTTTAATTPTAGSGSTAPTTGGFDNTFGVAGSSTIGASLMPSLIEAYSFALGAEAERVIGGAANQSLYRLLDDAGEEVAAINLNAQGSADAFPGLISGTALIGMTSRPIKDREAESLISAGIGPLDQSTSEHILALDGLAILVSPENPIRTINIEDVADVFSGDIDNWAVLGGEDAPINLYVRTEDSGTYDTFREIVLDPAEVELSDDAERFASDTRLADAVVSDPYGIGVTGLAYQRGARALSIESACGLIIDPSEFNVKTEEYPLSRRLYLYTTGKPLPKEARGLLDYALSDDAQLEIADIGFVSHSISSIPLNQQGRRIAEAFIQPRDGEQQRMMREMALELLDAERLSTTLRFKENSSVLDVKSEADLIRLARYIAGGGYRNKEVVLIGFADDIDRFEAALSLSEQRAGQIRALLEAELIRLDAIDDVEMATLGFGPLAPVACADDEYAKATNRRVEVWVRDAL